MASLRVTFRIKPWLPLRQFPYMKPYWKMFNIKGQPLFYRQKRYRQLHNMPIAELFSFIGVLICFRFAACLSILLYKSFKSCKTCSWVTTPVLIRQKSLANTISYTWLQKCRQACHEVAHTQFFELMSEYIPPANLLRDFSENAFFRPFPPQQIKINLKANLMHITTRVSFVHLETRKD